MLHVFWGPMYAGKTEALLNDVKKHPKSLLIKWCRDIRGTEEEGWGCTHSGITYPCHRVSKLDSVGRDSLLYKEFPVLGIDDGHFFPNLAVFCERMVEQGKTVYVTCLSGNWKREPFPSVSATLSLADRQTFLLARCACGKEAPFTRKNVEEGRGDEKRIIEVGGKELYTPVCRRCYFEG